MSRDVLLVDGGSASAIRGNFPDYPGQFAITLHGDARGTTIAGNRVVFPGTAGIVLEAGRFTDTTIDGNEVSGALSDQGMGGGILVGRDDSPTAGTRVRRNDVHENYDRGILVGAASTATAITGNTVRDNTYAGVENAGVGTAIRANRLHDDIGLTGVAILNTESAPCRRGRRCTSISESGGLTTTFGSLSTGAECHLDGGMRHRDDTRRCRGAPHPLPPSRR